MFPVRPRASQRRPDAWDFGGAQGARDDVIFRDVAGVASCALLTMQAVVASFRKLRTARTLVWFADVAP